MHKKKRPKYRHRTGRPSKFTEGRKARILETIRSGNYAKTAAVACDVSEATWYRWQQKVEMGVPEFCEFWESVKKALAEAEVDRLSIIGMAAKGRPAKFQTTKKGTLARDRNGAPILLEREVYPQWTAAAWCLERMSKTKFGRYLEQHVEGPGPRGEHVFATADDMNWDALTDAELRELKAIAAKLQPAEGPEPEGRFHTSKAGESVH